MVLTGDIMTMRGLPRAPAANAIGLDEGGEMTGFFWLEVEKVRVEIVSRFGFQDSRLKSLHSPFDKEGEEDLRDLALFSEMALPFDFRIFQRFNLTKKLLGNVLHLGSEI